MTLVGYAWLKFESNCCSFLQKECLPAKRSMTNMSMYILDFDAEAADCNGIVKSVGSLIVGVT